MSHRSTLGAKRQKQTKDLKTVCNARLDKNKCKHLMKQNQLLMQYHEIDLEMGEWQL